MCKSHAGKNRSALYAVFENQQKMSQLNFLNKNITDFRDFSENLKLDKIRNLTSKQFVKWISSIFTARS